MKSLLNITIFIVLIGLSRIAAAAEQEWPPIKDGTKAVLLIPATRDQTTVQPEFHGGPVFYGKLEGHNAEEIRTTKEGMVVLRRAGYTAGQAAFRWEWPAGTTPSGEYELWTLFTQGGISTQKFDVSVGPNGSNMDARATFTQSSDSWKIIWRKAPSSLVLNPDDRLLDVRITGNATQQKQFAGFLLVRAGDLPPGLSVTDALEQERDIATEPLINNSPASWLTVGTWAGPAGISLWGLDYEKDITPFDGLSEPLLQFDRGSIERWRETPADSSGRVVIQKLSSNFVWSKGAAYAFVYLWSPKTGRATLRLGHTGQELAGWLNGNVITWNRDNSPDALTLAYTLPDQETQVDHNDQGGEVVVNNVGGASSHVATLDLKEGWNRLMIKPIMRQRSGEVFAFTARFSTEDAQLAGQFRTSLKNPFPVLVSRNVASRYVPTVHTNAPFNLVHSGEPLTLDVDIGSVDKLAKLFRPLKEPLSRDLTLELRVTDYDGQEILSRAQVFELPGKATFDLGRAPERGYYAIHLRLLDQEGNLVVTYPSDGFSVIGGVAAQLERKTEKKMAVTYYFMAARELYKTLYFPYMQRIGIFRDIGGHNTSDPEFFRSASEHGLYVMADMWSHRDPDYVRAYVEESAPYVDSFKSYNEVDIHPNIRGTPESWVAKAKQEYEIIKSVKPEAIMVGASLVRPAGDNWFADCLKLGLANYHDVWDVHCYPKTAPVLEGSMSNGPNESELGVLQVYAKLGIKNDKPFWVGETGARCSHGLDARRWQADMVAKMTACAMSRSDFQKIGFLVPFWCSRERGGYLLNDIEAGHMPAEAAYYTASALIDSVGEYAPLQLDNKVQTARFGPTVMAWTTDEATRTITLTPQGDAPFVQVDVVGRVQPVSDQHGQVSINVGSSPVYILSQSNYDRLTQMGAVTQ